MIRNRAEMYISSVSRDLVANLAYSLAAPSARRIFHSLSPTGSAQPAKPSRYPKTLTTKTGYCRRHLSYKEKKKRTVAVGSVSRVRRVVEAMPPNPG